MSTDEKPTVEIAAVPDWAVKLTEKVVGGFSTVTARLDAQDGVLEKVVTEGVEANTRLTRVEDRIAKAEQKVSDIEDRLGRTSGGVSGLRDENADRDRKIAETHDLASKAATKEDVAKLAEGTATKAEVKELLEAANKAQTNAIVEGVKGVTALAEKSPTVRTLLLALAGLVLVLVNAATNYITARAAQSSAPAPTSITVTK